MRLTFASAFVVLLVCPAALDGRQATASDVVTYAIDARLDPANRLIAGREHVISRNRTSHPAAELRFHLAWNAWRDGRSSWMREQRLAGRDPLLGRGSDDLAVMDVTSIVVSGSPANLAGRARFVAPDDGNADDRTVWAVPLDSAVPPGGTIALDLTWNARVPRPFERTGVIGRDFIVAQWLPRIAAFDDAGWRAHQIHVDGGYQLDADIGTYDLRLTLPAGWIAGASGRDAGRASNADGSVTHHFVADRVDDVAWAAAPDFLEDRERIDLPGGASVRLHLLLQPDHVDQWDRHVTAIRTALAQYASWLGPFPWPDLTVVDPPTVVDARVQGASLDEGVYPGLVTSGTRWLAPWTAAQPEDAILRAIAGEYWAAIAAPDEGRDRARARALVTYAASLARDAAYRGRFVHTTRYFSGLVAWPYADLPWTRDTDGSMASPDVRRLVALERLIGVGAMRDVLRRDLAGAAWRPDASDDAGIPAPAAAPRKKHDLTPAFFQLLMTYAFFA